MRICIIVSVATFLIDYTSSEDSSSSPTLETTSSPTETGETLKKLFKDYVSKPDTLDAKWTYDSKSQQNEELEMKKKPNHEPLIHHPVTRLVRTLSLGLNPYFQKDYFEPFERRQRPITVVGMRRHGFFPRYNLPREQFKSDHVAVLQSPYNDISSFWMDDGFE